MEVHIHCVKDIRKESFAEKLGSTIIAIFSHFLSVTTALFGWLILKETIPSAQMLGGAIVIAAGYLVTDK